MAWIEYQAAYTSYDLERARDSYLDISIYDDGAISAPSSGTISIYDPAGTAIVDAAAVTVTGNKATYTLSAATVTASSFGMGWRVEWSLVMGDTMTHVYRSDASLVRIRLAPVITDADLLARHSDLDDYKPSSSSTGWETWILEAWKEVGARLEMMGRRPYLIISAQALRPVHLFTTLAIICTDLGGTGDEDNRWARLAESYSAKAEDAWSSMTLVYDEDDSGSEPTSDRVGGTTTMWLARSPGR